MQFTAFPLVFQGYRGWTPGVSALAFIGVTIGAFFSLAYIIFKVNPDYAKQSKAKGYLPPEARLPSAIVGSILLPYVHQLLISILTHSVGLFIFAWTCTPATIHWIAPMIATVPYGAGIVLLFLGISVSPLGAYSAHLSELSRRRIPHDGRLRTRGWYSGPFHPWCW
jgi:hypothetical protein